MTQQLPRPRIPSPTDVVAPLTGVETAVLDAARAPFRILGLPELPRIPGVIATVQGILGQLPAPPQIPALPSLPKLPGG